MFKENENKSDAYYTRRVKAGQRYYYVDAKKDSKGNDYIVLTESKNADPNGKIERHRIFIYREDFEKFQDALADVISFVKTGKEPSEQKQDEDTPLFANDMLDDGDDSLTIQWPEDI